MKRALFFCLAILITSISSTGCSLLQRHQGCSSCAGGGNGCGPGGGGAHAASGLVEHFQQTLHPTQPAGPPVGTVAYPYYTVRGPRDFLLNNPQTLGP